MEHYDAHGHSLGEGTEIYNGDGELIGYFFDKAKDSVSSASDDLNFSLSAFVNFIFTLLFIAAGWALLGIIIWSIVKVVKTIILILMTVIKFLLRCIWWLLRAPFCWLFNRELPEF